MADKQYLDLVQDILTNGELVENRTGTPTMSVFGRQMRFDLNDGFPALTTKRLAWKAVVGELLWFLEGSDDERRLAELTFGLPREECRERTTIWTANADKQGRGLGYEQTDAYRGLGPVYGVQWRRWEKKEAVEKHIPDVYSKRCRTEYIDQISQIIHTLKTNPTDRRIILTAWAPHAIEKMSLPPCHVLSQFRVLNGKLNCLMYQRSCDVGLGVPFNIASYALLTHILAREVGLEVGEFVHTLGDAHIYVNHIEALKQQLAQEPFPLPQLCIEDDFILSNTLEGKTSFEATKWFKLDNYQCHKTIKMDMAV